MRRWRLLLVSLFLVMTVILSSVVRAQTGIVLEDADDEWTTTTSLTNDLTQSLANVSDHIIVDTAAGLSRMPLVQIPANLQSIFGALGAHLLVDQANSNLTKQLAPPGNELGGFLSVISPTLILDQANSNQQEPLLYPFELIADQSPPVVQTLLVTPDGPVHRITWQGNEFTRFVFRYGTTPGVYTETITQPLYEHQHIVELEELEDRTRYYFIIESEDISGNKSTSQEQSFIVQSSVFNFLPSLWR